MAWVYPIDTVDISGWYPYPSTQQPHLCLHPDTNFEEFVWTYADYINYLVVDMGQSCTECAIWAKRGTGNFFITDLTVKFYDAQNQLVDTWVINLTPYTNWNLFQYTPATPWRYVRFEGDSEGPEIAVAELRGQSLSGFTRRLLTGVGL